MIQSEVVAIGSPMLWGFAPSIDLLDRHHIDRSAPRFIHHKSSRLEAVPALASRATFGNASSDGGINVFVAHAGDARYSFLPLWLSRVLAKPSLQTYSPFKFPFSPFCI